MSHTDGIFPIQALKQAAADGWIAGPPLAEGQLQPASLDLRLGTKAYRIQSSFLPQDRAVAEVLPELSMYEIDLEAGEGILERGNVYLIPLMESLALPEHVQGRTNPKSSTGRLDIFTRVITDNAYRFEEVRAGYTGPLYLEVVPRSFTVRVAPGLALNQLRLFSGQPRMGDAELAGLYRDEQLLYDEHGAPVSIDDALIRQGLFMSIDLKGDGDNDGVIGYKARRNSAVVDLTRIAAHPAAEYWDPIRTCRRGSLILEPEEFYIFASRERVRVPNHVAAEMVEYDAGSGELRTHYAGFFDSGFGYGDNGAIKGTRAVLEVRPHDVPFRITHAQVFFKLVYEHMIETPVTSYGQGGSHYQGQGLALSKHFKN
ncbi:MAG: 2'-deoxycytidine 5'-triphosphate deaminase [Leptospirillia bacterium]